VHWKQEASNALRGRQWPSHDCWAWTQGLCPTWQQTTCDREAAPEAKQSATREPSRLPLLWLPHRADQCSSPLLWVVCEALISKVARAKWTGGVTQAVERLLCRHETLSSNPSPTKNKNYKKLQKVSKGKTNPATPGPPQSMGSRAQHCVTAPFPSSAPGNTSPARCPHRKGS
jgi:hypothetical protein